MSALGENIFRLTMKNNHTNPSCMSKEDKLPKIQDSISIFVLFTDTSAQQSCLLV